MHTGQIWWLSFTREAIHVILNAIHFLENINEGHKDIADKIQLSNSNSNALAFVTRHPVG